MNCWKYVAKTTVVLGVLAAMLSAGGALAQQAPERKSKLKGTKGTGNIRVNDVDRGSGGGGGEELAGPIEIEGKIYKPSVFYVVARRSWNYESLDFKQDFVDRIVKGALKRPF